MRRSLPDWLALAASDPSAADEHLDRALAQAETCHDWRTILADLAARPEGKPERLRAAADRTFERAVSERAIWGFRDVAEVRATRLDDVRGAREALEACAALFGEGRAHGYEWVLLAEGFVGSLGDRPGARRCLEAGRDGARAQANADDLAAIAVAWGQGVDRAEGLALLAETDALAANGSASPWTLANAWHALDDVDGAARVLDAALAAARGSEEARHVARAWSSHQQPERALRALARAEALASSAGEWLAIAEVAFDGQLGEARVRRALERAGALAADDGARARVAGALHHWLGDEAAAARVGSRGVRPEALRERVGTLDGWEASAQALFDWLRARVTTEQLTAIAHADYGMDAAKHLAALRDVCENGIVPRTLVWEPHEVLALTRWSTGERTDHLARALCCTLLCLSPSDFDELVTNGAILAESCLALGAEAIEGAERLFAWYAETEPDDGPDHPASLLLLFLLRVSHAPSDPRLDELARSIVEHPACEPDALVEQLNDSMRAALWTDLIEQILGPERARPAVARVLSALGR